MTRPLLALALVVTNAVARVEVQNAAPPDLPGRVNTVYLSVTEEQSGAPVLDLAPEDFLVKEDGKNREVTSVRLAREPLHVMLLVDDNGSGIFRSGLIQFIQQLQGHASMGLSTVVGQTHKLVDYTANAQTVANAAATLSARPGTNDGGQLLEGIYQSARDQQKLETSRPVIVALTVGGEEHSTVPAHLVLDQLAKSRSKLYVIQVAGTMLRPTVPITQSRQLLNENLQLGEVLGEGPKQTGGWREEIVAAPGLVPGLQRIAAELKNQYALEYARPPKGKPLEKLDVSVKRRGLNLRAPTKVAGR
jgi:VWFA-related protein